MYPFFIFFFVMDGLDEFTFGLPGRCLINGLLCHPWSLG